MLDLDALADLDQALADINGDADLSGTERTPAAVEIARALKPAASGCPHLARMAAE